MAQTISRAISRQDFSILSCILLSIEKVFSHQTEAATGAEAVTGLRSATLLKKRLWHRCFPVIFAKFLRTSPVAASG